MDAVEAASEKRAAIAARRQRRGFLGRAWDSDLAYSFRRSKLAVLAALVALALVAAALLAPWISPHDPFDLSSVSLLDSLNPPAWEAGGNPSFPLGTDNQGRDILSAILHGMRISLFVGVASVALAAVLGVGLGLVAGYFGGVLDSAIMRVAEVQLTFPAILIALLVDGVLHASLPGLTREESAYWVLIVAIGLAFWVQYARTVRGSTLVERNKDYVQAARLIGLSPLTIMVRHVLPNVLGPVLVIATINLALAVITEATLSFLGVGIPPTRPSLGTLIRIGNNFLFSGEWWIAIFPSLALVAMALSVNVLGDWLRDALNPRLR